MELTDVTTMLSALSHATRYRCYALLASQGDQAAAALAAAVGIPKNLLSSHVSILLHAGLITSVRQGRSVIYSADTQAFARLLEQLQGIGGIVAGDGTAAKMTA